MRTKTQTVTRLDYCQYLLVSQINYTLTNFADHSEKFSHDALNRYVAGERLPPKLTWENVKSQVIQTPNGFLVFDDTVADKNFSHEIELVRRQYSGNAHGVIKGIGIVTCVYVNPDTNQFWIIDYRIYDPDGDGKTKLDHMQEMLRNCADRGSAMTSKPVALLLADLGMTKTHSRSHVSNDNPYSKAQFETMKYHPDYPTRFGCLQDARAWAAEFFNWYNREHHHTGLALLTPAAVHFRRAEDVLQKRQAVLQAAYEKTPERFVKGVPRPIQLPKAVWINPPISSPTAFIEHSPRNENENSHCKSAVPVSFGATSILHEFRLQTVSPLE